LRRDIFKTTVKARLSHGVNGVCWAISGLGSFADAGDRLRLELGRAEKSMPPVAEYIDMRHQDFAALKNVVGLRKT
jgi:hypothetical protein